MQAAIFYVLVGFCTLNQVLAAESKINFEAVVRISHQSSTGSGTCFSADEQNIYILTNYHVVQPSRVVNVEFWSGGHLSQKINGDVIWRSFSNEHYRDIAVVRVSRSALAGYQPSIIPLVPQHQAQPGQPILSAGCANGAWATAFQGHVDEVREPVIRFTPPPANGRSGSALLNETGARIIGLIAWRSPEGYGVAMTANEVHRAFLGHDPIVMTDTSVRSLRWDRIQHGQALPAIPNVLDRPIQQTPT